MSTRSRLFAFLIAAALTWPLGQAVADGIINGSSSAAPSGAAGGDLAGTYPNPTFGTIIAAGGPTGSATVAPIITYDAKGRLTVVSSATITPAVNSVTGFGTGIAAALGVNIGSAGAPVLLNGAGGTPSSLVGTNITGTAAGLTAGNVTGTGPLAWTPTDQSGASLSLTINAATYYKVGKLVAFTYDITFPTTASGSGVLIGGLPATISATGTNFGGCAQTLNTGLSTATVIRLAQTSNNFTPNIPSSGSSPTNAQMTGARIAGSCTYYTD